MTGIPVDLAYQCDHLLNTSLKEIQIRIEKQFRQVENKQNSLLYDRLYETIRRMILENDIPARSLLPSTRALAKALLVSRTTINRAYEWLELEGWIEARRGSGYRVTERQQYMRPAKKQVSSEHYPRLSLSGQSFLQNIGLIHPTDDPEIAFRPGLPPLDIFPLKQWQSLNNQYWKQVTYSDLSYYSSSGIEPLKKSLANYLNIHRQIKCDYHQIIIVSGSLQSLFLAGNVLVEPGDSVVMENPTFPNVSTLFKSFNALVHSCKLDAEGIDLSQINRPASSPIQLIHVTPSGHYPTGQRMSLKRRMELLEFAGREKAIIIENDYEHEVSRTGQDIPTLFSLDTEDRTIYLGTFNRLLHPSIRIGFMVVPYYLLESILALQKMSHRFISPSVQYVMNQFIEKKHLVNHISLLKEVAQDRKMRLVATFEEAFGGCLPIAPSETEELHVLVPLPNEISETRYIRLLKDNNIVVHPYSKCFSESDPPRGMILGYSCLPVPAMKRKIYKMAELFLSPSIRNWYG